MSELILVLFMYVKDGLGKDIEGFWPEWFLFTIYHAWDTPFWSGTLDIVLVLPLFWYDCFITNVMLHTPFWSGTLDIVLVLPLFWYDCFITNVILHFWPTVDSSFIKKKKKFPVADHLQAQHSAIKMLHSRIKLILQYITAVEKGQCVFVCVCVCACMCVRPCPCVCVCVCVCL